MAHGAPVHTSAGGYALPGCVESMQRGLSVEQPEARSRQLDRAFFR
jgi:hypothetical protein